MRKVLRSNLFVVVKMTPTSKDNYNAKVLKCSPRSRFLFCSKSRHKIDINTLTKNNTGRRFRTFIQCYITKQCRKYEGSYDDTKKCIQTSHDKKLL